MRIKSLVLIALSIAAAFGAGWLTRAVQKPPVSKWELADAYPDWDRVACVPANEQERRALQLAVDALELEDRSGVGTLQIGAKKLLAAGLYRGELGKTVPVCAPEDIYMRLSRSGLWQKELKYRLVEHELRLFSRLPQINEKIVQAVGRAGFHEHPQQSEFFRQKDIRPYARTVLAGFGKRAEAYSDTAFENMSAADPLGTGAAQIAVATGHPNALPRIQKLMDELLSSVPTDKALPRNSRNRFYELAYAISLAGDEAKTYSAPIKALMDRKVESWAPPFGMIALSPKRMCVLLERIEGPKAIEAYEFCLDPKVPYEQ